MILRSIFITAALIAAPPVLAHETKGPNGGRVVDAGEYHVELVVSAAQVEVFLTDGSDQPVAASGFKGTAILVADGKAQRIALEPGPSNQLTGKSSVALPADAKGAVQFTAPGGKSAQGQFQ